MRARVTEQKFTEQFVQDPAIGQFDRLRHERRRCGEMGNASFALKKCGPA